MIKSHEINLEELWLEEISKRFELAEKEMWETLLAKLLKEELDNYFCKDGSKLND